MEIEVTPKVLSVVLLKVMTTGGSWVGDCRWWEGVTGGRGGNVCLEEVLSSSSPPSS